MNTTTTTNAAVVSLFTKFIQHYGKLAANGQVSAITALSSDKSRALAFADFCKVMLSSGKLTPAALAKEPLTELTTILKALPKDHPFRSDLTAALAAARATIPAQVLTCAPATIIYKNGTSNKVGMIEIRSLGADGRKSETCFGLHKWQQLIGLIDTNREALTAAIAAVQSNQFTIRTPEQYKSGSGAPITAPAQAYQSAAPTPDDIAAAIL